MKRIAFTMKLKSGFEEEYKKRHNEIWPELNNLLSDSGIRDHSIFLDEQNLTLFAVQKLSENNKVGELSKHPVMKKWWAYMVDIMECNPDNSPVVFPLKEVFYMK